MTSKISFLKQLREELKHHLVAVFVVLLGMFVRGLSFYFELQYILMTSKIVTPNLKGEVATLVVPNFGKTVWVVFIGVFLATEYFLFMHSRRKSDFYFSLPCKRMERLGLGAACSGSIFFSIYFVEKIIEIALVYALGVGSNTFIYNTIRSVVCTFVVFVSSWITMVLAMTMTGNTSVALVGFLAISGYFPVIIKNLLPAFQNMLYETYVNISGEGELWYYLSPIGLAGRLTGFFESYDWDIRDHESYLIGIIIYTVIIGIITGVLFQKRPTEAAGRAMAFEKTNGIIRFAAVIPLALYSGCLLYELSMVASKVWLIVGIIVGAILVHGIMESIYAFDIKKMFSKKRALIVSVAVCIGFVVYLYSNIFEFNSYIPKQEEVEKVTIYMEDDYMNFTQNIDIKEEFQGITGENIGSALCVVQNAIDQQSIVKKENAYGTLTVHYQMKNGKHIARQYKFSFENENNKALLNKVFATEDMKNDFYPILSETEEEITRMWLNIKSDKDRMLLDEEQKKTFLKIYKKELIEQSFDDIHKKDIIANFTVNFEYAENCYPIYENFEETIAYLTSVGYSVEAPFESYKIISLELYSENNPDTVYVSDEKLLESIKSEILLEEYYTSMNGYMYGVKNGYYGSAQVMIDGKQDTKYIIIRDTTYAKIKNK